MTQGAHGVVQSLRVSVDRVVRLHQLYEENQMLRRQIEEYKRQEQNYADMVAAFERMRRLLRLKDRVSGTVTAANIIGRNPDQWLKMAIIDVGSRDGVSENMVVVEPNGVAGRIIRVSERTSTVLLLTDPQSGVGVITAKSRDAGVAAGQVGSQELVVRFFGGTPRPSIGEQVLTSGYGGVFPPGLVVGQITAIDYDSQGLVLTAVVKPAVDFDRLSEVLVLESPYWFSDVSHYGSF